VSAVGFDSQKRPELFLEVVNGLWNGLTYLHNRGVAHNDFSYRNCVVVVVVVVVDDRRAVIIDLACARPISNEDGRICWDSGLCDFDIHMKPSLWRVRPDRDIAALAYTLCILESVGKIPWKPIGQPCMDDKILKERDQKTLSMSNDRLKDKARGGTACRFAKQVDSCL
jgi:hypothetical protein